MAWVWFWNFGIWYCLGFGAWHLGFLHSEPVHNLTAPNAEKSRLVGQNPEISAANRLCLVPVPRHASSASAVYA